LNLKQKLSKAIRIVGGVGAVGIVGVLIITYVQYAGLKIRITPLSTLVTFLLSSIIGVIAYTGLNPHSQWGKIVLAVVLLVMILGILIISIILAMHT
jgi:hypothetical protein